MSKRRTQATEIVAEVFTRLAVLFPRTFDSAFRDSNMLDLARRELASELAAWPILPTRGHVDRAMSRVKQSGATWPPTVPEIVALIKPSPADVGMPAVEDAWTEANAHAHAPGLHRWSHDAVRLAGKLTGWRELHETTAKGERARIEKRFARQYHALMSRVMNGEPLSEQHLLESDQNRTPAALAERASLERAQALAERYRGVGTGAQALASIRRMMGGAA